MELVPIIIEYQYHDSTLLFNSCMVAEKARFTFHEHLKYQDCPLSDLGRLILYMCYSFTHFLEL